MEPIFVYKLYSANSPGVIKDPRSIEIYNCYKRDSSNCSCSQNHNDDKPKLESVDLGNTESIVGFVREHILGPKVEVIWLSKTTKNSKYTRVGELQDYTLRIKDMEKTLANHKSKLDKLKNMC